MDATTAAPDRIVISDLCKSYGDLTVFDGIDLAVGEAEIVSLVGPSGCGKTTLLRCIDGLIPATAGQVSIDGEPVTEPREGVAIVFQHFGLFPWKTVQDNVGYGLRMAGMSKREVRKRVPKFIQLVGLEGFEESYPYQLSGGMQQRAGLARALAIEPRVLLMDEPFGALDAQTRELLQFELLSIWQQQPTSMVFVTHAIEEAVLMGHRIVLLKGRPSSVAEVIEVDLPWPRTRETLSLPRFQEIREHVWGQLMGEAAAAVREQH
ncbi:ABC transporter ATP-binding protein [Egicoccus sp. AB-alg6-2]|uniref:ABC transporter ATP-binding protein n=1 Tax=Egicoccus sp. AB-alg6-2 TaxID=3242692 RepID=UPI00359D74AA